MEGTSLLQTGKERPRGPAAPKGKVRLLFLIRWLGRGGAERQLVELARGLDKDRFEVTVATAYDGGALWGEMSAIPGVRLVSLHKQGRWDLAAFGLRFLKLVREVRPHVTHGYMGISNEMGFLARAVCGSRVVWGIRGSGCDYSRYHDWARGAGHRLGARLSRFADLIIANSHAGRDEHIAEGYCARRMIVIPNGIDTRRFYPAREEGRHLRREWGVPEEAPLIGMAARLDPMKGHGTFIEAAARLLEKRKDARFVCVGSGPEEYREALRCHSERLGLRRRLLWREARDDMRSVYNAVDFLTSSSTFGEGFSNVIGEALACDRLVVVTDVGDSARIVADPRLVVPPGDPEALAAAWEGLLREGRERLERRARGEHERIAREYSVERLTRETALALSGLLAR